MIFREETITDLPDAHWLEAEGHVVQGIDDKARYADLIILGQYECEGEPETHPLPIAHSIVVKCGRPVLVVPSIVQPRERLRIAIAWDGSREAVRATHDALPLLRMAESVQIVTIIPPSADHDHFDTTSLPVHLAKHEINVRPEIIKVSTAKKHELFQKLIAQGDYDLLVMGAHSHPLLDYFFGGATKSILFSSQIPVFVSL